MIVGCQNTTEKIVVENKISTELSKKDNASSNNKNFSKNKIIKSEITLNVKKLEPKQNENDVVFEFRNERLLQGRDKLKVTEKSKANQALSAVFKMLKQNLSLDNNNLNLKSSGKISLENKYFDLKKDAAFYNNILAFLPLTGSYANYGIKIRKALDLSVLNYGNDKVKMIYFDTGKIVNEQIIKKLFNNINPSLVIGPFRREILLNIKPIAKTNYLYQY
ncbi:MAG: hypothetical protein ACJZ80_06725 [Candidatus Puniceispirillales bacterium]